ERGGGEGGEGPHRRQRPRRRARGQSPRAQAREVAPQVRPRDSRRGESALGEEAPEGGEVGAVGGDARGGEAALDREMVQVGRELSDEEGRGRERRGRRGV